MSIKTITVYLDSRHTAKRIIRTASNVAEQYEAHLIGLYVTPMSPIYIANGPGTGVITESYFQETYKQAEAEIKAIFKKETQGRALVPEWRETTALASVHGTVARASQTSDLLIIGADLEVDSEGLAEDRIRTIIGASHRPTMVVPAAHEEQPIGKNVLVAWDGSAECTRAVFGALPILKNAASVDVLMINASDDENHITFGTDAELVSSLSRHGVNAELSFTQSSLSTIAEELLRHATEKGSDMIVMGAYGASRMHDFFVGSVTRKVLAHTSLPLVMSH